MIDELDTGVGLGDTVTVITSLPVAPKLSVAVKTN